MTMTFWYVRIDDVCALNCMCEFYLVSRCTSFILLIFRRLDDSLLNIAEERKKNVCCVNFRLQLKQYKRRIISIKPATHVFHNKRFLCYTSFDDDDYDDTQQACRRSDGDTREKLAKVNGRMTKSSDRLRSLAYF